MKQLKPFLLILAAAFMLNASVAKAQDVEGDPGGGDYCAEYNICPDPWGGTGYCSLDGNGDVFCDDARTAPATPAKRRYVITFPGWTALPPLE